MNLPCHESETGSVGGMIKIESNGTVFDIKKFGTDKDGAAYFALTYDFYRAQYPAPQRNY